MATRRRQRRFGIGGYRIYRAGTQVAEVAVPATTFLNTALTASTTYAFSIRAFDNSGNESGPSAVASAATPADVPLTGALNVPLIVQEAIYPGVSGIARTQDPVTVGIPLSDGTGVRSESQLGLSGSAVGQFRILGRWPSGNAKWVLVDTLADVAAGGLNSSLSLVGGRGSFGGNNLATDQGATILVNTGIGQFVVRKARFNVLDSVVVNNKPIVAPGTSQGLVVLGPAAGEYACGACATVYSSANDAFSSAFVEENGPVRAVIKAVGRHRNAAGEAYLGFTVRLTFHKGKGSVKVTSELRNADYGSSHTVTSAYKGFESYDLRLGNALTGSKSFAFGTHSTPAVGSLSTTDSVYLYQASSASMKHQHWGSVYTAPPTKDPYTYQVIKNGAVIASGDTSSAAKQYPQGWADVRDATGAGIEIGVYQLAAYWPKSLEFLNGGSDVRVGIWPRQSTTPVRSSLAAVFNA